MNKEDKKSIGIFVVLLFFILTVFIYNIVKNNKTSNIDRKVININGINYNEIYKKSEEVFFGMMDLLVDDGLTFEKNNSNRDIIYSINNKEYKKITNISNVLTKISNSEIDKFIKYKDILYKDNNYYLLKDNNINTSYIGSKIKIDSYTNEYVMFISNNYYCDDYKYIGIIDEDVECNYKIKDSTFKLVFVENNLVIENLDSLINIIK